jgi:hypothetical protein
MKRYIVIIVAFFLIYLVENPNFFKPTNYLECKNSRGTFYLKIIQSKNKAEEYPNSKYKKDEVIKIFELQAKKNYFILSYDGQNDPMILGKDGKFYQSKSYSNIDDITLLNRETLNIYDPLKRINLAECISKDNKI